MSIFIISGLMFEPNVDNSPLIHYSIRDMKTYHKYLNQLDFYMYGKILSYSYVCPGGGHTQYDCQKLLGWSDSMENRLIQCFLIDSDLHV